MTRFCRGCGRQLLRHLGEFDARFSRRQFCSIQCVGISQRKANPTRSSIMGRVRRIANRHKKSNCERCGSTEHLLVHHKNGHRSDNSVQNLETLCDSCHRHHHNVNKKVGQPCPLCGKPAGSGKKGYCKMHYNQLRYAEHRAKLNGTDAR